jgi:tyrosyl-tRNA synthetase
MDILSILESRGLLHDVSDRDGIKKLSKDDAFYIGIDPSAPSLGIGNLIPVIVTIHLARAGLKPIFLFGGSTGAIGDPSGKSLERQLLDRSTIDHNIAKHQTTVSQILDRASVEAEFVNNFDWTKSVTIIDFLRDTGKYFTVNYMLAKEVIKARLGGDGISFTEFSYMLLQAFDFLHLYQTSNCKLQIGGSDQWGNITAGLELIRKKAQGEAYALSWPLITDSQGKKFGKTEHRTLVLDGSPYHFHQFFLNVEDADVARYLNNFTFFDAQQIAELEKQTKTAPEKRAAQHALADAVCTLVYGQEQTKDAKRSAEVLFGGSLQGLSEKNLEEIFSDVPSSSMPRARISAMNFLDLLAETGVVKSKSEGRKLIAGGGAYLNNERISDPALSLASHTTGSNLLVLRTGRKSYHLLRLQD